MEASKRKQNFLGDNPNSKLIILTDTVYPLFKVTFGGNDEFRDALEIDAEQFISVKGFKAKGKRVSTWTINSIEELEPTRLPEPEEVDSTDESPEEGEDDDVENNNEDVSPDSEESPNDDNQTQSEAQSSSTQRTNHQLRQDSTGQLNLFPDEE